MSKLGSKQDTKRGAVDWEALELEYILGAMTQRELAESRGINSNTLMAQANKRKWDDKRKQKKAETSKAAEGVLTDERISLQIKQNKADLDASEQVARKALDLIMYAEKPADIKAISGALKDAQAMARLALGMTTENNGQGDFDGNKLEIFSQVVIVAGKAVDSTEPQ